MFSTLSQTNRFLQLKSPLGEEVLTPVNFFGTEGISSPFKYTLKVISSDLNIDPKLLLHKPVTLTMKVPGHEKSRYFNGIVHSFEGEEIQQSKRYYTLTLVPWFACLKHSIDCRIFLDKTVVEIFEALCEEHKFWDFDKSGIKGKHLPHDQNTQYNESAFSFLSRLLEEEGIFYYFKHEKDKHTMVLADNLHVHQACDSPKIIYNPGSERGLQHSIKSWGRAYHMYSGKHSNIDYNYETPTKGLEGEHDDKANLPIAQKYETYCSAGQHQRQDMGDVVAKRQFHAQEFRHELITGASNHAGFSAGYFFELEKHTSKKEQGKYILYSVSHSASDGSYESAMGGGGGSGQHYTNEFVCFPKEIPYSPLWETPQPRIFGPQTATVVGKDEIYVDSLGRVLVQFHWVREGKAKHDKHSCWARVAQSWAGKGFGTWFLPRRGHEVVVQFIDGDPDRPLITGSVYNPSRKLPFPLTANKTQSGIKTRSSKDGSDENFNELRFEDKKGEEEIFIQAEKDFNQKIKHNLKIEITNTTIIESGKSITFKVGESAIQITPDKINLYSPLLSYNDTPIVIEE